MLGTTQDYFDHYRFGRERKLELAQGERFADANGAVLGAEVAAALGLGIPAMKARLFRARLMLREALAPHFVSSAKRMSQ